MVFKDKEFSIKINKNLLLKNLLVSDVTQKYVDWMNDYEIVKYTEQRNNKHTIKSICEYVNQIHNSNNNFLFGIFFLEKHIGNIKIGYINWKTHCAEISYIIGNKNYWGKGIATKVLNTVTNFGFRKLGLKKISAGFYEINKSSYNVLKKCGYNLEAEKKSDMFVNENQIRLFIASKKNDQF